MLSPEVPALLDELESQIAEVRRLNALDVPEPLYKSVIGKLADVRDLAAHMAVGLAVDGVLKDDITRRSAAIQLRMHPSTMDKWVTRFEEINRKGSDPAQSPLAPEVISQLG